jgi:hypothetical protein
MEESRMPSESGAEGNRKITWTPKKRKKGKKQISNFHPPISLTEIDKQIFRTEAKV